MTNNELRIEDLEGKVESQTKPKVFTNQIEVPLSRDNPESVAVYSAEVWGLRFYEHYIFAGSIYLKREDKLVSKVDKKKIVSWFPFRTSVEKVAVTRKKFRWGIGVKEFYGAGREELTVFDLGKIVPVDSNYKKNLIELARKKGIAITPTLIDSVFGPIDEQLKKNYDLIYPNTQP